MAASDAATAYCLPSSLSSGTPAPLHSKSPAAPISAPALPIPAPARHPIKPGVPYVRGAIAVASKPGSAMAEEGACRQMPPLHPDIFAISPRIIY